MKKTISNILFAALVVLAAASCHKELGSEAQSEGFRTITCYMETPSDTKALGGITPQWVEGAKIWISNGTSSETVTLAEGDITGNNKAIISTSLTGTLYAVYPASAQNGVTEGKIGIKIPTSTDGGFENAHIAVAQGDGTLSFKNAVTILKITTEAATAAVNVASTANISGEFSVTYGATLTVAAGTSPTKSVTLTSSGAGDKYVAIAPGAAFKAVTFTAIKSANFWAAKTSTSSNTTAINTVYSVGGVSGWTYTDNGSLWAQFSVSATKKVRFAKGNLQATYSSGSYTWAFASNQYDYVGNAAGNTSIGSHDDNAKVDLFGWTVKDKYSDGIKQYGINTSETDSDYGDSTSDELSDWETLMGPGWSTLTGGDSGEWCYLLDTRIASTVDGTADARYVKATVCEKVGLIIFPDVYTHPSGVTAPTNINTSGAFFAGNTYDSSAWSQMESAGCVFLPAAGIRGGSSVNGAGDDGHYWSATPADSDSAYLLYFVDGDFLPADSYNRSSGQSVRLVYSVSN